MTVDGRAGKCCGSWFPSTCSVMSPNVVRAIFTSEMHTGTSKTIQGIMKLTKSGPTGQTCQNDYKPTIQVLNNCLYDELDVFWKWIVKDFPQAWRQVAKNVYGRPFLVSNDSGSIWSTGMHCTCSGLHVSIRIFEKRLRTREVSSTWRQKKGRHPFFQKSENHT